MCFFVPWLCEFFNNVLQLASWLIFAALLPFVWPIFRPMAGFIGPMLAGAVLMFLALTQHWLGDDSKKIERLERELEAKTAQLEISKSTTEALQKSFMDEALANEQNERANVELQRIIAALGEKPECDVSKDFTDALKDIR